MKQTQPFLNFETTSTNSAKYLMYRSSSPTCLFFHVSTPPNDPISHPRATHDQHLEPRWWLQANWKIFVNSYRSFQQVGMKMKNHWNHHLVNPPSDTQQHQGTASLLAIPRPFAALEAPPESSSCSLIPRRSKPPAPGFFLTEATEP